ncbi:MAG: hypothetical protein LBS38_00500 [Endomicrobium sp.]|nr:hypothetical protein [Endomicrobium sp.]
MHRLFGYSFRVNKDNKKQIYPNEDAPKVKRIFNLLEDGYNQLQVIEIMEEELFFSVQNKLNGRSRSNKFRDYDNPILPLKDYIYCHDKDHKMTASRSKRKFPYYHCQGNNC